MYCRTRDICVFLSSVRNVQINVHFGLCAWKFLKRDFQNIKKHGCDHYAHKCEFLIKNIVTDFFLRTVRGKRWSYI